MLGPKKVYVIIQALEKSNPVPQVPRDPVIRFSGTLEPGCLGIPAKR